MIFDELREILCFFIKDFNLSGVSCFELGIRDMSRKNDFVIYDGRGISDFDLCFFAIDSSANARDFEAINLSMII